MYSVTWGDASPELAEHVRQQAEQCLNAYRAKPNLIEQDAGIELSNVEGGYGKKQLNELVQNASDALLGHGGAISLVLASGILYAANEGSPLTRSGVETLMASHLSRKRDEEIGRFGLGFKSVLGISDRPEVISRSVSIRFDREESERLFRDINPDSPRTPVLRIGFPFDPIVEASTDPVLKSLMDWATTIVRLPLKTGSDWLAKELVDFPPEFLLFAEHVHKLTLRNIDAGTQSSWRTEADGSVRTLRSENQVSVWNVYKVEHEPSAAARLMQARFPVGKRSKSPGLSPRRGAPGRDASGRAFRRIRLHRSPASSTRRSRRTKIVTTFLKVSTTARSSHRYYLASLRRSWASSSIQTIQHRSLRSFLAGRRTSGRGRTN